jgi:hypothetical protein
MAEDMFDKAREAFFGSTNVIPKANASPTESRKPRRTSSIKEITGPFPEKHEADQLLASVSAVV